MSKYKSVQIHEVIDISHWYSLDEGLAGSRAKRTVAEPGADADLFVFKEPKEKRSAQIWSELLASFICGDLLHWPVQHSSIAVSNGRVGNLLEYIFDLKFEGLVAGEQLCKHYDPNFDPEVGTRHTWTLIKIIHEKFLAGGGEFEPLPHSAEQYRRYWARTIAFDTLISNTDRHAENWGFLLLHNIEETPAEFEGSLLAPFYDNASSMGCEVEEIGLKKWFDPKGQIQQSKVKQYASRGCHHLRNGTRRYKFEELAIKVLQDFPQTKSEFEAIANLNLGALDEVFKDIYNLSGVPEEAKMTHARQLQIMGLLHEGQARVIRALEENK